VDQAPGSRAFACAGLPGADWWVTGSADVAPEAADVDLSDVEAMFTENDLWRAVFDGLS
jgi:hypothetical protein